MLTKDDYNAMMDRHLRTMERVLQLHRKNPKKQSLYIKVNIVLAQDINYLTYKKVGAYFEN